MWRKLIAVLTALIIITGLSMPVFAGNTEGPKDTAKKNVTYTTEEEKDPEAEFFAAISKILSEGEAVDNGQTILLITKPEEISEKVSIYSKKFSISVKTEYNDVVFSVARLNEDSGKYEIIEFDGEKSIIIACGTDSKEINLEYGTNHLLLISYRDSEKVESKVQYNTIVVEANKETVANKAIISEKTIKKSVIDTFTTVNESLKTFVDNLLGKGK